MFYTLHSQEILVGRTLVYLYVLSKQLITLINEMIWDIPTRTSTTIMIQIYLLYLTVLLSLSLPKTPVNNKSNHFITATTISSLFTISLKAGYA